MTFTLTGTVYLPDGSTAHTGQARVTPLHVIRDLAGNIVMTGSRTASLSSGAFSFANLPDSSLATGYSLDVTIHGGDRIHLSEFAAGAAGSTVDLSDLVAVPTDAVADGFTAATTANVAAVQTELDAFEASTAADVAALQAQIAALPTVSAPYTYYVSVTGSPNAATYTAKTSTGATAGTYTDTATTSGLKALLETLGVANTHFHFGPGRFHFIDAPLGTESFANTECGASFNKIDGLTFSGEGIRSTVLSTRSNTITASPDLAVFLFTNCRDVTIRDMTIEFCGAYMSTMEAVNCNQGNDFLVDRVQFKRSKSTTFTYDGGDVGKSARHSIVRNCLFYGRPKQPQVDLITTGGTLTNGTTYTYAVAYRDLDLAYLTGSTATCASTTATVTTASAHDFATGDVVTVQSFDVAGYNGRYTVTVTGASTFTYTVSTGGLGAGTGGVVVGPGTTKVSALSTSITTANGTSSAKVYLSTGPYTTAARVVYRYDGTNWKLVQTVADNTTASWTDTGVAGTVVSTPIALKSNIPHSGIQLLAAKGVLVDGNVVTGVGDQSISGASAQGIRLAQKQSTSCDYNIVVNNRVSQSGSYGIHLVGAKSNVVSNNVVSNPGSVATKAQAIRMETSSSVTSDNNVIAHNRCYDDQSAASPSGGVSMNNTITIAAGTSNLLQGNYLSGGASAGVSDSGTTSIVKDNVGFNPQGPAAITVTASPFTYTAGSSPEMVYISGGTVSNVTRSGTSIGVTTPATVRLEPNQAVVVTYSVAPTMVKDRL